MGELDAHPVGPEPVHQIGERGFGGSRPASRQGLPHMPLAASGQDVPMPTGGLGQRVEVIARLALLPACEVGRGELPRQSPVPLRPACQDQQVRPWRIGNLGAGHVSQREFGAEHRLNVEFPCRFGESNHPVQPVVVGQRNGPQVQPGGLLDELLRGTRPVEEAERRVGVQFGIRGGRASAPMTVGPLVAPAFARPGRAVPTVAGGFGQAGPGAARLAGEHPLHLTPGRRPVVPTHRTSLSNICSTVDAMTSRRRSGQHRRRSQP